ncbi:MAG: hypothetical protein R3C03_09640 [Pirellulaceae bacterium]
MKSDLSKPAVPIFSFWNRIIAIAHLLIVISATALTCFLMVQSFFDIAVENNTFPLSEHGASVLAFLVLVLFLALTWILYASIVNIRTPSRTNEKVVSLLLLAMFFVFTVHVGILFAYTRGETIWLLAAFGIGTLSCVLRMFLASRIQWPKNQ